MHEFYFLMWILTTKSGLIMFAPKVLHQLNHVLSALDILFLYIRVTRVREWHDSFCQTKLRLTSHGALADLAFPNDCMASKTYVGKDKGIEETANL